MAAVKKYGTDAFRVEPIKWAVSQMELDIEEMWYIAKYTEQYGQRMIKHSG